MGWKIHILVIITITLGLLIGYDTHPSTTEPTEDEDSDSEITRCHYFNETLCSTEPENCTGVTTCKRGNGCYVVWSGNGTDNETIVPLNKGCWPKPLLTNCTKDSCIEGRNNTLHFCCCIGDLCNQEFEWKIAPTPPVEVVAIETDDAHFTFWLGVFALASATLFGVLAVLFKDDEDEFEVVSTSEGPFTLSLTDELRKITLLEMKGSGKFGSVWKGISKTKDGVTETVAVKVMRSTDAPWDDDKKKRASWITEHEMYTLIKSHPNIVRYIGAESHPSTDSTEFRIVMEYYVMGSVFDVIKVSKLNWGQLAKLVYTAACGLEYLHRSNKTKNSIVHRDVKSSNILVKEDYTACIGDFGLALELKECDMITDASAFGQVGTRRYMAPELLEGAVSFTPHHFLLIDMYAFAIVCWEMVSRCCPDETHWNDDEEHFNEKECSVGPYKLPFEEEIGTYVNQGEMIDRVCRQRVRPTIKEEWKDASKHQGMALLCQSIEECWDHDPEGRLMAAAIVERMRQYATVFSVQERLNDYVKFGDSHV